MIGGARYMITFFFGFEPFSDLVFVGPVCMQTASHTRHTYQCTPALKILHAVKPMCPRATCDMINLLIKLQAPPRHTRNLRTRGQDNDICQNTIRRTIQKTHTDRRKHKTLPKTKNDFFF